MTRSILRPAFVAGLVAACAPLAGTPDADAGPPPRPTAPSAAEAAAFVDSAEAVLAGLGVRAARASWVQSTYITHDTEILAAEATERWLAAAVDLAMAAARYADVQGLDPDVRRKIDLLRTGMTMPAPSDPAKTAEVTRLQTAMESRYGRGQYCRDDATCWDLQDMTRMLATSRDEPLLREIWSGWRSMSVPMRSEFQRFVDLGNEGAEELGFTDVGALWRSAYDMDPDAFSAELDRLWGQVEPLYSALHCHVAAGLERHYGSELVRPGRPIPAHLLGNMWAQSWTNVYDLVAPPDADPGYDLNERLEAAGYEPLGMVRTAEQFFSSLGLEPLPATFWERSMFVQPRDRDVVCHASAWNIDDREDLRIKMCIEVNAEDFQVIHHELGHNYYQRAYRHQPYLFRGSANDGFHEALGDAVALSVTPEYLRRIGLIDEVPPPEADLGLLMWDALDKVAFLPFGLLVDQWRWRVFSGEIAPDRYNQGWWELRERYQGVVPPMERTEAEFDPGAKYHVPANVPYTRYFLAHILQFQFHRALCEVAGFEGPLHRCSVYGNREVGDRLRAMMEMGLSRPWPDALEALTGQREMDATAILDYFAPLRTWLDDQNRGRPCAATAS